MHRNVFLIIFNILQPIHRNAICLQVTNQKELTIVYLHLYSIDNFKLLEKVFREEWVAVDWGGKINAL